jgi:hypothetical protein
MDVGRLLSGQNWPGDRSDDRERGFFRALFSEQSGRTADTSGLPLAHFVILHIEGSRLHGSLLLPGGPVTDFPPLRRYAARRRLTAETSLVEFELAALGRSTV